MTAREQAREAARATVAPWARNHPEKGDVNWKVRCDLRADAASDVWEARYRALAAEMEALYERHGCGQIECSVALDAIAAARRDLGLRLREPF